MARARGYLYGTFTTKRFLFCPIFGSLQRQSRPRNFHCGACEPSGEEDDGSAGGGGPDPAVAVVRAAGEHAGSVLLDVAGAGYVLAVVAPVAGRAEALRSKFPLEDSGHFDAIVCLQSEQFTSDIGFASVYPNMVWAGRWRNQGNA